MTSRFERKDTPGRSGGGTPVLVLGGRGFVGSHVTRRLVDEGHRPFLFGPAMEDDLLADIAGSFDEMQGTIERREDIATALRESGARRVVTTVAYSLGKSGLMRSGDAESDKALAINVLGFRNLLEAALSADVKRIVWTSSTVVYGQAEDYPTLPVDEDAASRPLTFYGLTKQMSEDMARYYRNRHDLDVVGLRLPLVLGPGLWYQGVASLIMQVIEAAGSGDARRIAFHDDLMDLMHVSDVATAITTALFHPRKTRAVYNINGFAARMADILAALERRQGSLNVAVDPAPATLRFPPISDTRFRDTFGCHAVRGLEDVISSILDQGGNQ